jgi:hypothetical protein
MDGVRPVTPTEVEQMREEIFKDQESESILQDEDKTEEEDFPTYVQDSQEYMHWHYRLNHPTHTVMTKTIGTDKLKDYHVIIPVLGWPLPIRNTRHSKR